MAKNPTGELQESIIFGNYLNMTILLLNWTTRAQIIIVCDKTFFLILN